MPPAPFIVGVPRSGTTLLRLQLDAHPELARLARASGRSELRIVEFWGRMSAAEAHAAQAEAHAAQAEERAAQAEDHAAQAEERAAHAEERADGVERRLGDAEYLLGTKRARAGLAVGRAADRLRWRS